MLDGCYEFYKSFIRQLIVDYKYGRILKEIAWRAWNIMKDSVYL